MAGDTDQRIPGRVCFAKGRSAGVVGDSPIDASSPAGASAAYHFGELSAESFTVEGDFSAEIDTELLAVFADFVDWDCCEQFSAWARGRSSAMRVVVAEVFSVGRFVEELLFDICGKSRRL